MLKAGWIQGEGFVVSGVLKKFEPPSLATFDQKQIRNEKVIAPKVKGVKNSNKSPNTTRVNSQTLKKFLSAAIRASGGALITL